MKPLLLTAIAVLTWAAASRAAEPPQVAIEFRRAEFSPTPGYTLTKVQPGQRGPLYIAPKADLTNADVAAAQAVLDDRGRFAIEIQLTEAGGQKLKKLSTEHLDKPLAILVDGKLHSAPVIRSPLDRHVQLSGNFDKASALRLARGIVGKAQ